MPIGQAPSRTCHDDGTVGEVDLEGELWGPVFEPLREDPQLFRQVRVDDELGTIVWPNGADMDPDVVGEKRGVSLQIMSGDRAAAYLSAHFVRGSGGKATLQENARNPNLPRLLIWLSPTLSRSTGVTMRNLRRCPQLWAVRLGLLPPPSWPAVELARIVVIAGPWPARGP